MELIHKYFPELTDEMIVRFGQLEGIYRTWNEKINLISRKDIDSLYEKHVLHSLAIAKLVQFKANTKVLDVGTGGGFPGIPLAIMFPETQFHLVDSIGKKITVVNEVIKETGLKNVKAEACRAENLKEKYDFIVSRAVTSFPEFFAFVKGKVSLSHRNSIRNGILYLKGGDFSEELKEFKKARVHSIKNYFEEEFFETKSIIHLGL
ncbi:MAG: 16S rRNA (guanine(527)-N(7))-methyltransferase [Bacteroidetes bacterium GWF2_38_335]|nr:MAG: 16S rRNA (guanine(527)-N(7))-methyltransferase [Bacteroidetes bacterium GWF2_38_335]OFY81041.1 MAG: 16S rRNA (guanine(527)-N(7))-methyltransferase [Bacteroidetes bacterium RIFOXYA12_FULL_38_20]HBS87643.1 16S rRNA (guanine(527)-N(7))-methyltransferase RsmG [Bacteroidales bacterium]